jgi:lactoylglutathione lyase
MSNPITGLFETHINVFDLERSRRFYEDVLGLELGIFQPARHLAIYWLGARGEAMLGLWEKPRDQIFEQHFAFRTTLGHMRTIRAYLTERGLAYQNFLNDGTDSLHVFGWMPAVSVYFRDPDGHSLELISMLPDAPRPELGVIPWERWEALHHRGAP